jgi:hypothetical protein
MSLNLPSACSDCGGSLREVTLFGRGIQNAVSGIAQDTAVVHFAAAQAKRGFWLGMFDAEGTVHSLLCGNCRRVFLYAAPYADEASDSDALHCLECGTLLQPDQQQCPACAWSYQAEAAE